MTPRIPFGNSAALLLLSASVLSAQTAPSLSDTATWLRNTYASHARFELANGSTRTVSVTFSGCTAHVMVVSSDTGTEVTDLDLGHLDPQHATPHTNYEKTFGYMLVRTWDGAQSMRSTVSAHDAAPHAEAHSEYTILLPLGEYTTRTAKAWIHAIELCGGKPSAF